MAEEVDDPVVHEIDVFLSKTSAQQLFLFQYPVRPVGHDYDDVTVLGAKIKSHQQKIELSLHVNTRTPNYSRSKGEQLALNVDGHPSGQDDNIHFKSGLYDKQILTSSPAVRDYTNYAVGLLKDGQLHVTPLKGIVQLKPDLSYLDQADNKHKNATSTDKAEGDSSQDEADDEPKAVVVKFGRQETELMKARRLASYEHMNQVKEEELWTHLLYHGIHSNMAERERLHLQASSESGVNEFQMSSADYFKQLLPEMKEQSSEKPSLPTNVLSLSQLKTLPLSEQVRALLINAKTIRFAQLLALLPGNPDSVSVLRYLQQVASLVQGCWVVKSEILYPKDTFSAYSGVSAEIICRGRDYIMWKFTQGRYVVRKDISSAIKLPAEEVKELLEHMSRMKANLGWQFLFEYDKDFIDRHTDIAQRQKMLWDARFQTLCTQLKLSKETEKKGRDQMGISQITQRKRRPSAKGRSRTLSGRSCSDFSDTDTESSTKIIVNWRDDNTDTDAKVQPKPKQKSRKKKASNEQDSGSNTELSDSVIVDRSDKLKPAKPRRRISSTSDDDVNMKHNVISVNSFSNTPELNPSSDFNTPDVDAGSIKNFNTLNNVALRKLQNIRDTNIDDSRVHQTDAMEVDLPHESLNSPVSMQIDSKSAQRLISNENQSNCSQNVSIKESNLSNGQLDTLKDLDRELEEFAVDLVRRRFVVTQSELKRLFALKLMSCPAGHILGTGVSYHLIEAAVIKAGAVKITGHRWPSDAINEATYVTVRMGDNLDSWREVLVELFTSHHRIKLSTFREALEERFNCSFTDEGCKDFLRNYCTPRGSKWILKGTWVGNTT